MKLCFYELKKMVSSPITCVLCVLLLLLSFTLTAISAYDTAEKNVPQAELDALIEAYMTDAETVMQQYETRQATWEAYEETIKKMTAEEAANYPPPVLPDVYATGEEWTDDDLYRVLFDIIEYKDAYTKDIATLLKETKGNYQAYLSAQTTNYAALSLQYRYLTHYYPLLQQVELPLALAKGWNVVFFGVFPDVLCGLMILILISPLFTSEKTKNFYSVLRTTKKGRRATIQSKLCAALISTFVITLVVSVGTLLTVVITTGVSDPSHPIQLLTEMKYCPWNMSMLSYWFFSLGLKIFAFGVLALIMCCLSSLSSRSSQALLPGLILWVSCGAGLLLPKNSFWATCNLLSLANVYPLGTRYQGYELFRWICIDQLPASMLLWGTIAIIFVFMTFLFVRNRRDEGLLCIQASVPQKAKQMSRPHKSNLHRPCHSRWRMSLFAGEVAKLYTSRICVIVLALFLLFEIGQCIQNVQNDISKSEAEYRNYTTVYAGEITEETVSILTQEKQQIDRIMAKYETMLAMAREGTITEDEWQTYILDYADAYRRVDAITRVVERLGDLSRNANGATPWLLYDTGWQRVFNHDADIVLILTVIYFASVIFPVEYRKRMSGGAFFALLTSTKHGRMTVLRSKCIVAALIGVCLTMIAQCTITVPLLVRNEWVFPTAPLSSLALFDQSPNITIGGYWWLCFLIRIVSMMLLSVSVCLISALFRREIFTLITVSVVLFFPHVLAALGMQKVGYFDFLGVYSCTPLLCMENTSIATLVGYLVTQITFTISLFCFVCWRLFYRHNAHPSPTLK